MNGSDLSRRLLAEAKRADAGAPANLRRSTLMREAASALEEGLATVRPFARLADEIAIKHPGWDHDAFEILGVAGEKPVLLGPYRAAAAFIRKYEW